MQFDTSSVVSVVSCCAAIVARNGATVAVEERVVLHL